MSMSTRPDPETPQRSSRRSPALDIAIVGLARRSPDAENVEAFWRRRLSPSVDATPVGQRPEPASRSLGVGLDDVARTAHEAVSDAGLTDRRREKSRFAVVLRQSGARGEREGGEQGLLDRTMAMLGSIHPEWSAEDLQLLRDAIASADPPLVTPTASRVAERLGLTGSVILVDLLGAELAARRPDPQERPRGRGAGRHGRRSGAPRLRAPRPIGMCSLAGDLGVRAQAAGRRGARRRSLLRRVETHRASAFGRLASERRRVSAPATRPEPWGF
jgi:hypothetical protein